MREIINIFLNIFKRSYDIIIFGRYWYINQKTLLTWNCNGAFCDYSIHTYVSGNIILHNDDNNDSSYIRLHHLLY